MKPSKFYSYFMIMYLLPLLFLFPLTFTLPSARPQCHSAEHAALLQFKESFITDCRYGFQFVPFAYPKAASWKLQGNGSDCCSWDGVECNEGTGHVIGLDLNASCLYGSIDSNSSLFRLLHLQYLNLAYNNFNRSRIPSALGNLSALNVLQLSNSRFSGQIPSEISRLSKLSYLDLSSSCSSFIFGMHHYEKLLELKNPGLRSLVQNLSGLEYLSLDTVDISSQIPDILANLSSLRSLSLYDCGLQGSIPASIFALKNLQFLGFFSNNLSGMVDLDAFLPLKNLRALSLSLNNFVLLEKPGTNGTLPELTHLGLASCSLSAFPLFLTRQNKLQWLNLSWNNLRGKIPDWFWRLSLGTMEVLELSNNYLTSLGLSLTPLPWPYLRILDLSSNLLRGPLPIPPFSTGYYSVSNNSFSGEIPDLICNVSSLRVLDLSKNSLCDPIPQCLGSFSSSLSILNLENNELYGAIPPAWTNNNSIRMISLGENKLQGQIPRSLASCKMLEILDLGDNQLNDTFPSWMGTLSELKILILRLNMFHGKAGSPETSFSFRKLQILDLSSNNFTGKLPVEYFLCWNAMQDEEEEDQWIQYMEADTSLSTVRGQWIQYSYIYSMTMTNKGIKMDYSRIVRMLRVLDFSCNKFEGDIPVLIGNLKGLLLLNLSNNILSGFIPASIGNLTKLEALDLSQNRLSGVIPQQLVQLTFLEVFSVSYNHLTGRIPRGKQFDTFQNNSFDGNPGLDMEPLSGTYYEALPPAPQPISDESFGLDWKFVLIGYASGFAFGTVVGHIAIERKRDWFAKFFRVRLPRRQRRTRRRHGN